MRNLGIIVLLLALVVGCAPGSRSASVQQISRRGTPAVEVALIVPGKWRMGGHNVFPYRELHPFTLVLPKWPRGRVTYDSSELTLRESGIGGDTPVVLSGGHVEIDHDDREIVVALQTPIGEFWANGRYPTNDF